MFVYFFYNNRRRERRVKTNKISHSQNETDSSLLGYRRGYRFLMSAILLCYRWLKLIRL